MQGSPVPSRYTLKIAVLSLPHKFCTKCCVLRPNHAFPGYRGLYTMLMLLPRPEYVVTFSTDLSQGDIFSGGCQGRDLLPEILFSCCRARLPPATHRLSQSFKRFKCKAAAGAAGRQQQGYILYMVLSKAEDMICANINSQDWLFMKLVNVYLNKCTCDILCKTGYYVKISALYIYAIAIVSVHQ